MLFERIKCALHDEPLFRTSNARLRTRSSLSRRNTILSHNNLFIYSVSKNETSLNDVFSDIPVFQSRTSKRDFFIESRGFT
jgi:hypothetical protein